MVVAIGDQHHRAPGSPRGLRIVAGVAHHERARGVGTQGFAGLEQWQRVGLFALERVATEDLLEIPIQALGLQQGQRKVPGLVGQARQPQAPALQNLQPRLHTVIHPGVLAIDGEVVALVAGPCRRIERFNFRSNRGLIDLRQDVIQH